MATDGTSAGKMQSYAEETKDPADLYSVWQRELMAARKHYEKFTEVSKNILKRYRDERWAEITPSIAKINLFWSNTQVLKSTLYTRPPKVDVSRLYRDFEDDTARVAGIIMERLLNHDLEKDSSDFDVSVRQSIDDWLIVGQGQIWYRYTVDTEQHEVPPQIDPDTGQPMLDPMTGQPMEPQVAERIVNEDALSDYVYWNDFLCSPCRTWGECRWAARRVYMTRDALVERFGEDIGNAVPLVTRDYNNSASTDRADASNDDPWATAEVWEIWCKTNRKVYWVCEAHDDFLDLRDDPLELEQFFPCPEPLLANKTNNTLIPRADFSMARDQYQQIDTLAARLRMLIDACKVRGVYDKESAPALQNILTGTENKMVPVDSWAMFAEKGGLKGVLDFVPVDMIVGVISTLRQDMADQKQELYETLGIADIMRGATRASETATAQQIKAQFGSTRLQFKQYEVARFVRDAQRIKANIIAKHYQPETMIERSNVMRTPDAQHAQQAIALLKDGALSEYRLNIEADSMAAMDWANERESRTQFMGALGSFVQQMSPLAQMSPETIPTMLKVLQWSMAGFRAGKEIEGVLDQAIQAMSQKPQGPDPQIKAEQDAMKKAQFDKVNSETAKNSAVAQKDQATAARTVAETHGKRLENMTNEAIQQSMAQPQMVPNDLNQYLPEGKLT